LWRLVSFLLFGPRLAAHEEPLRMEARFYARGAPGRLPENGARKGVAC